MDEEIKKSNYTEEQIAFALKKAELGTPVSEVCRKLGIAERTFAAEKAYTAGCCRAIGSVSDSWKKKMPS